jgi:putative ABC transport system substrate-binding protein
MKRREFITLLGGAAAAWPLAARAQPSERMRRIGVLLNLAENDPVGQSNLAKLQERLGQLGWRQGFNLELTTRWTAGSPALAQDFARELLRMQPDVVVANGGTATSAALKETRSVPIVFITDGDPVRMGFVASLGRPGGNATGFTGFETTIEAPPTSQRDRVRDVAGGCPQLGKSAVIDPAADNTGRCAKAWDRVDDRRRA